MKKKFHLALDVDGVLANFSKPVEEFLLSKGIVSSFENLDIFCGDDRLEAEFAEAMF